MTTHLAQMNREEQREWLSDNAFDIARARADFEAALERYASVLASRKGSFEHGAGTAARFVYDVMDRADAALAEEVRLELGI